MYAKSVHKTELSNLTKNEIVLRPKHGAPLPSPQFRQLEQLFSEVETQDLKDSFGLNILYVLG